MQGCERCALVAPVVALHVARCLWFCCWPAQPLRQSSKSCCRAVNKACFKQASMHVFACCCWLQDVPAPCGNSTAADIVVKGDISPHNARPVSKLVWSQDGDDLVLSAAVHAANSAGSMSLIIPGNKITSISSGAHTIRLVATNHLNVSGQGELTFTKRDSGATPVVSVLGGPTQTFRVAQGISVSSQLLAASVCSQKTVSMQQLHGPSQCRPAE